MKIVAVVVTYNRKILLKECLIALLDQSYKIDQIILIDNNSTDNTYQYLVENNIMNNKEIIYKKLDENIGGAGGFYEGMKEAQKYSPDFIWIMDDDTIPTQTCLFELIEAQKKLKNFSFLASSIFGEGKEFMNVPQIDVSKSESGYPGWYEYLAEGIVKIREATFVSLLINNKAVKKCGLPIKDYFIWGDDTEYTLRLVNYFGNAYLVGKSVAIHKRKISKVLSIIEEDNSNRIQFYYYMIRNNLINKKVYYGRMKSIMFFGKNVFLSIRVLFSRSKYKVKKIIVIYRALLAFLFRRYDKKAFQNRFDIHVRYKK